MSKLSRALLLCLAVGACQRHVAESAPAPTSDASPPPAPETAASRLPEDPEAGARSVAQWREHLEEEERERKLRHDRRKLRDHRRVSQLFRSTQKQYDRAASERAVTAAQNIFRSQLPQLEKSFDAMDHYGESSLLVPQYRKLVEIFEGAYPSARIAALGGSKSSFDEVEARAKQHFETISEGLKEAARDEDE